MYLFILLVTQTYLMYGINISFLTKAKVINIDIYYSKLRSYQQINEGLIPYLLLVNESDLKLPFDDWRLLH